MGGQTETAEFLIDKGADVNAVDTLVLKVDTALDIAKELLKDHTKQLTENSNLTDWERTYHSEQISDLGKIIGILIANGAECTTTC